MLQRSFFCFLFGVSFAAVASAAGATAATSVQVGLDRLDEATFLSTLQGKRLGLVSHSVSQTSSRSSKPNTHAVDWISQELKLDLKLLFAPEHGLRSVDDSDGEDGIDPKSGLPVISLYKVSKRALDAADWAQIDVLLVDLQDVGVRYYTYPSTVALLIDSLQTARAATPVGQPEKEIWILDRPNPLGGEKVEGSRLESSLARHFISFFEIPTRHGMTMGEIARMYVEKMGYEKPGTSSGLRVVKMVDWDRSFYFSDTGLNWVAPSPALVTADQAKLYSVFGPLEAFDLSVGRGLQNDQAFRRFGAPWITTNDAAILAANLNAAVTTKELRFSPIGWKVTRAAHDGQWVEGVEVTMGDFSQVQTREAAMQVASVFADFFGAKLAPNIWAPRYWGSQGLLDSIFKVTGSKSISDSALQIEKEEAAFLVERRPFLIY
ncbi:MAG: DUF1343 domain-containing protein [Bdellovibrionales bacterium]|nr:DUF1343 domain-containing protein [Bdellovibrionales bacterium]